MTKIIYPNIVRGGVAIPLNKRNYYYIKGRLHKDGGVDIGENPKTGLEVEGGEIVKMEQDGIKVFSAVPMLAGTSPAKRVLRGENPDKVFAAQERFKDVNKINDDGTKAQLGKRKYIGSNEKTASKQNADVRRQYWNYDTKLAQVVSDLSSEYGIDPRLVIARLNREGIIDSAIRLNNRIVQGEQYDGKELYNKSILDINQENLPFANFGLDTIFDRYTKGYVKTNRPIYIEKVNVDNEKENVNTGDTNNMYDTMELFIAELAARQNEVKKKYPNLSNDELMIATNANFNTTKKYFKDLIENGEYKTKYKIENDIKGINIPVAKKYKQKENNVTISEQDRLLDESYNVFIHRAMEADPKLTTIKNKSYDPKFIMENESLLNKVKINHYNKNRSHPYGTDYSRYNPYLDDNREEIKQFGGENKNKDSIITDIVQAGKAKIMDIAQANQNFESVSPKIHKDLNFDDIINDTYEDVAQRTYLFNRKNQEKAFLNSGYIKGVDKDYGLVEKAVGNRNLPVYQKNKDVINRSELEVIGNLYTYDDPSDKSLYHAGSYPVAIYKDKNNKLYFKGWDLHDYGLSSAGSGGAKYDKFRQIGANLLDKLGNPSVITTGYQNISDINNLLLTANREDKELYKKLVTLIKGENGLSEENDKRFKKLYDSFLSGHVVNHVSKESIDKMIKTKDNSHFKDEIPYESFIKNINKYYNNEELENYGIVLNKKRLGGNMKHKLIEVNIGGNSKLIRVPRPSSTGKSERSEGYNRKQAQYGVLEPLLTNTHKKEADENLKFTAEDIIKNVAKSYQPVTLPTVKISVPQSKTSNKTNFKTWLGQNLNPKNNPSLYTDGVSLLGNIAGSLISHNINKKMINSLKAPSSPVQETARKLKTKYNINPQEKAIKDSLDEYERQVLGNTASSRVALARINKGRNSAINNLLNLYGQKENIETQLLNQDTMNQQDVDARNIERINKHLSNVTNFNNRISELKAENSVATTQNIISGISDLLTRREERSRFNKTLSAQTLANPNLPAEMFKEAGIWNKKMYDTYRKYNPLKQG